MNWHLMLESRRTPSRAAFRAEVGFGSRTAIGVARWHRFAGLPGTVGVSHLPPARSAASSGCACSDSRTWSVSSARSRGRRIAVTGVRSRCEALAGKPC
jgi:hypothetical protein